MMKSLVGQKFGQYELTSLIGEGGMAAVYGARRLNLRGDVAVKVIKTGLIDQELIGDFNRRFKQEAEIVAGLSHPHILKLFDYGQQDDVIYLVMELLTGGTLAQLMRRETLPLDTVLRVLDQVASALDYAHDHGIIHRDLKPQNVLLDERGNAVLSDFGIAKLLTETTELTRSGALVGTPAYMAPEQWRGQAATKSADIYALGAVLFEMLAGRQPFVADTPHSMMHMHIYELPPELREFKPDIQPVAEQVVAKALAKDPTLRFESASALASAFRDATQLPMQSATTTASPASQISTDVTFAPDAQTPVARITAAAVKAAKTVFISYTHPDQDFAEQVRQQLLGWQFATWMDSHDIPKGAYWPSAIDEGLQRSDFVVGVMTPEALASRNVRNEWDWALENNKPLLLLMLRPCEQIPHRYISINYIEFLHNIPGGFAELHGALRQSATPYRDTGASAPAVSKTLPTHPRANNRTRMLQKVHDYWIAGVLDNVLPDRKAFALDMAFAEAGALLKHVEHHDYALPTTAKIIDVFDDMNRELLILGQPGAGKTILLLQLTRDLISRARADEAQPIPVVFNLSSWAVNREPVEAWLISELRRTYQVPRKVATAWVNNGEVLPLLDGLDEVLLEFRDDCIEAINRFRQEYSFVDMVVCSRVEDYEKLTNRLNLHSSIILQPLTPHQIDEQIQGTDLAGLRTVLKTDEVLQQMAQSPFLLNTMVFAYRDLSAAAQSGYTTEEERRNHLFKAYVERRFQHQDQGKIYSLKQIFLWLPALSHYMVQQGQTVFFIERMQPSWLRLPTQRWRYVFSVGLVGALISGLGTGLFLGGIGTLTANLRLGITSGLIGGVVFGLAVGLFYALSARTQEIQVAETLNWSWSKGGTGIFVGVGGAIIGGLAYGIFRNSLVVVPIGLVIGLAIGLAFGLTGGLVGNEVRMKTEPNQGIRLSARNALLIGLGTGLLLAALTVLIFGVAFALYVGRDVDLITKFSFGLTLGLIFGLPSGLCFGLALALIRGGKSVIQHVILRSILHRSGQMPTNYSRFLDFCARLNIMRKVGGGYMFVHRYLLEYFAALR